MTNQELKLELHQRVEAIMPEAIARRRYMHQQPELSGYEEKTAAWISQQCQQLGYEVRQHIGGHGLMVCLKHETSQKWLAFRADMDALPIQDGKKTSYTSKVEQVTHACGHDAHSTILLSTLQVLGDMRHHLRANIAFIFQPAEETCHGAYAMLKDGLFDTFKPDFIYALHVYPSLPAGSIGIRQGVMCAAADMFDIRITGRGGHAARPHEATDVVLAASHMIQALHHIVSRRINPLHPAVLTIGQIEAGHAGNIMPDHAYLAGTFRSLEPHTHDEIRSRMEHIICQTAETWGACARLKLQRATPVLCNDEQALQQVRQSMQTWLPDVKSIDIDEASMGGEDFSEFLRDIPGCLLRLGTGSSPQTRYPLHHPCFDIDESSMRSGILTFCALALNFKPES